MLILDILYKLLKSGKMKHVHETVALRYQVLLTVGRSLVYMKKTTPKLNTELLTSA